MFPRQQCWPSTMAWLQSLCGVHYLQAMWPASYCRTVKGHFCSTLVSGYEVLPVHQKCNTQQCPCHGKNKAATCGDQSDNYQSVVSWCAALKNVMTINVYCEYCTYKVSYVVKYSRYNKKEKKKELDVIQQGIRLVQPEMASSQPLPPAAAKPASLPTVNFPAPFTHTLPQNSAGQANVRGNQRALPVISPVPLPIQPTTQRLMLPHHPVLMVPPDQQQHPQVAVPSSSSHQSRSTYYYNKRKQEKELTGVRTRKYTRSDNPIVCGKCGKTRDPALHRQYFGNWFCQTTEKVTYEQWKENFTSKGYGKKKKNWKLKRKKKKTKQKTKNKQQQTIQKKLITSKKNPVHRTNMSSPKHQSLKVAWAHQRILFK